MARRFTASKTILIVVQGSIPCNEETRYSSVVRVQFVRFIPNKASPDPPHPTTGVPQHAGGTNARACSNSIVSRFSLGIQGISNRRKK